MLLAQNIDRLAAAEEKNLMDKKVERADALFQSAIITLDAHIQDAVEDLS